MRILNKKRIAGVPSTTVLARVRHKFRGVNYIVLCSLRHRRGKVWANIFGLLEKKQFSQASRNNYFFRKQVQKLGLVKKNSETNLMSFVSKNQFECSKMHGAVGFLNSKKIQSTVGFIFCPSTFRTKIYSTVGIFVKLNW